MSKKKILAIVDQDKTLTELCGELDQGRKQAHQRLKFIRKQEDDLETAVVAESRKTWDKIEKYLTDAGKLPSDYSRGAYNIQYDDSLNALVFWKVLPGECPIHGTSDQCEDQHGDIDELKAFISKMLKKSIKLPTDIH